MKESILTNKFYEIWREIAYSVVKPEGLGDFQLATDVKFRSHSPSAKIKDYVNELRRIFLFLKYVLCYFFHSADVFIFCGRVKNSPWKKQEI